MIYMNNMAVCNYIVGVLGAIIGGLIMQAAAAFPLEFTENGPGPGFWPFTLGAVLGAVSVLLLLYTFINKTDLHGVKVQLSSTGNKRVLFNDGFCRFVLRAHQHSWLLSGSGTYDSGCYASYGLSQL